MKLWEICRFEVRQQLRGVPVWLYFAVLAGLAYTLATAGSIGNARRGGYFLNAPFVIASVTVIASVMGLLMATSLAGDAGARDVRTRMHPLLYTTPVREADYLGGRFLAAFVLNLLVLSAVPVGLGLAALLPRAEAGLLGPFRPGAYLAAFAVLALPNAFVATAVLFSLSVLGRRALASYLGSGFLLFAALFNWQFLAGRMGRWGLAKLLDPFGLTVLSELSKVWTAAEKNALVVGMQGSLIANRVLWLAVAAGVLAFTRRRFRFADLSAGRRRRRGAGRRERMPIAQGATAAVPRVRRTFGSATHARQTLAIAWESFRVVATGWGGLALALLPIVVVLTGPSLMEHMGVPLRPTTARITAYLADPQDLLWLLVPLLVVIYAGELVWREREARFGDILDALPVPEPAPFVGKLLGLGLVLVLLQALMMAAGMLVQVRMGYPRFEPGLYAEVLFGLQLPNYLLFTVLALAVHTVLNDKYSGHAVLALFYGLAAFAAEIGIEDRLLVYGSDPGWSYSDLRGFAPFLAPFVGFKLYWAAWALLLALMARLFWVRGRELDVRSRIRLARRRLTRGTAGTAAVALGLILMLGGFIFYNTHVLNAYRSTSDRLERRAEYERRYGRYQGIAQPRLTGVSLRVEIHPDRRTADVDGTFELVNRSAVAIESVHVDTSSEVETRAIRFDRPSRCVLKDDDLGHRIYALEKALQPGESLHLSFQVRSVPRGFPNRGIDPSVVPNGTYFVAQDWLPAIGYQAGRELQNAGDRQAHGLPARPREDLAGTERIAFDAVVGTGEGQTAVAPGRLVRTWTENGRRYFHYLADTPIRNDYAFASAAYAVREARWNGVAIQIYHHPDHAWNVERTIRAVRASLDSYVARFGPYPYGQIRLVEHPGDGETLHSAPINISYEEGFSHFDPRELDLPFAVVAHEVAHQWWGNQLTPARVEGGPVLTEGLAWYSAMGVVEKTYGRKHLDRLLARMREAYLTPHARASVPLLRATDAFQAYRKGPFAMYALREYVGQERVDAALRSLLRKHGSGEPPLPTSLDLYRELQAVTPPAFRPLLADLFEANTYWELAAERVTARQTGTGSWEVTLDVRARKVVVDPAGVETEVPMDDPVEIGVLSPTGEPLYLRLHRIRSGAQSITVTVPGKPARAGIDPRGLLIDDGTKDNVREFTPGTK